MTMTKLGAIYEILKFHFRSFPCNLKTLETVAGEINEVCSQNEWNSIKTLPAHENPILVYESQSKEAYTGFYKDGDWYLIVLGEKIIDDNDDITHWTEFPLMRCTDADH